MFLEQLARKARAPSVALVFFLVNLFLVYPAFLPNLNDINPWDESAYINSGRMLLDKGEWPVYANSPLVSVFYAFTYLPFRHSHFWLIQSCSLGRFLLFALLWWSVYLVAKQLGQFSSPLIMAGILLVSPFVTGFLSFPSDPLFAALAALSLWQLLGYYHARENKRLWASSAFMGLAALARNDGLILFFILVGLSLFLGVQTRQWRGVLAATLIPFATLVGGYVLFYGLRTGHFELGTLQRTYENFEAGQQVIFAGSGSLNPVAESKLEARRYFGAPEENHFSILTAIRRNPRVYLQRLKVAVKGLPEQFLHAYGIRFAVLFVLLALRGIFELLRQRRYALLAILCLWPAHLLTGFVITLFRPGHLLFPFYVVLALASIGLTALLKGLDSRRERYAWLAALLGLAVYGLADNKLAVFYGAAVFLVGLWIAYRSDSRPVLPPVDEPYTARPPSTVALLILLCAGLIIHGDFPSPVIPQLGADAREQAVVYLADNLPQGTLVAAASPGPVWMAKMTYAGLAATDVPVDKNSDEFVTWMRDQDIRAVLVDHSLSSENPRLWELIQPQIGTALERVFSGEQGDIQVLLIKP